MRNNARKQPPNGDMKPRSTRITRQNAIGAFVCFVVSLHASSALAAPRLAVPQEGIAFGEIPAGEGASRSIEIRNVSAHPVAVAQVAVCLRLEVLSELSILSRLDVQLQIEHANHGQTIQQAGISV